MHEATDSKFHPQLYDYIVVGGGTAGCPLAATLSQKFRVLLLERGGSPLIKAGVTPDNGASYDFQVGTQTGGTIFDDQGTRRPASNLLVYANPRNLDILLHAQVELILFRGTPGSPQLLLLSGVGPANQLTAMGIKVVYNLPGVGKQVSDNPAALVNIVSPSPVESALAQVVGITAPFGNFIEAACGVAVTGVPGARAGNIIEKVAGPLSSGTLVLQSKHVRDNPLVTFNYFQHPRDLQACIAGVNTIEEVILANSFRPFVYDNQTLPSGGTVGAPNRRNPAFAATINTTIANYCREHLTTIWHYHGGCLVNRLWTRTIEFWELKDSEWWMALRSNTRREQFRKLRF
ncbi:protein HOTHEAD [Selaginella moellendorffii]|uniref:protein HOTHEAD n=1 Tax=Selaginella moellendorffii TaxID=88036 RepID=UPI000D1C486D|nr:protein HOTHEAD [Selaginella moellendorffii]|eukprot:XP_024534194.1 protein HOTHEAD [Selaginella moellendorffii]